MKKTNEDVAVMDEEQTDNGIVPHQTGSQIAKASDAPSPFFHTDLNSLSLDTYPEVDSMEAAPIDYSVLYWTPKPEGELRRVILMEVDHDASMVDQTTGEEKKLPTAYFAWKDEKGNIVRIANSSARLVAALDNAKVRPGAALEIEYIGKIKNKTNAFMSDNWRIRPLIKS